MSEVVDKINQTVEFLKSDEAIPIISGALIVLLLFFSDLTYRLVETVTMLLFYAVLVRMWTALTPSDSELLRSDFSHVWFLLMSAGAVSMGIFIQRGLESMTGTVLPAQFLALSILVSRVYLYIRDASDLERILLLETAHDRYVVLVPCAFVILFSIFVDWVEISNILFIDFSWFVAQTTSAFLNLTALGIILGFVSYLYFEEEVGQ